MEQSNKNLVEVSRCKGCEKKKTVFEYRSGRVLPFEGYHFTKRMKILEGREVICSVCQVKRRAV